MRTYGDVADDLARAVARLVSTARTDRDAEATLAARAAVFDGIRHTVDALTGTRASPNRPMLADLELDPAGAFRAALHHLPRMGGSIGLTDAVADSLVSKLWIRAAAAALELTKYEEALSVLEMPAKWAALGDIAEIVITLVQVDDDLKASYPTYALPSRRFRAELRLTAAAAHAEARRRPFNQDAGALTEPIPARPWPIRRAADIPIAIQRVAAMIRSRDAQLTMHELGGVLQLLAQGLDDGSRILRVAGWRVPRPESVLELADRAEKTCEALAAVAQHRGAVMTLGPIDTLLLDQTAELRGAMRSLLNYSGTVDGASNLGPPRVSTVLATQSWTITSELTHALAAAAQAGQLLVCDHGLDINARHWTRAVPNDDRVKALLSDLRAATRIARPAVVYQNATEQVLGLSARFAPVDGGMRARGSAESHEAVRLAQR
jgi:hypothetical protein